MKPGHLLAMACAAAAATAHSAGPTIYGNIDVGITHATGIPKGSSTQMTGGSDFPNQIGFKGAEALGSGTSVIYNLATGFCSAGGFAANGPVASLPAGGYCTGGGFMQRTSLLGVRGHFGKLIGGRFLLPVYTNAVSIDPFSNGTPAAITSLNRAVSAFNYLRESQLVEYAAPGVGGLRATLVYGLGGAVGSARAGRLYNLSLNYRHGPLYVGVSYLYNNYATAQALESGRIPAGSITHNRVAQVFGRYDFGVLALSAMYQSFSSGFPGSTFVPVKSSTAALDNRFWMVGAAIPLGRGRIDMSYSSARDQEIASSGATMVALGYTYALSRSTTLYSGLSHISNDSAAAYGVHDASNTFAGSYGQAADGIAVGMRHSF